MAPEPLEVSVEVRRDRGETVSFVRARGDIDLANAAELDAAVHSRECEAAAAIVLDLREVPFIDSSGLQVVLNASREVDGRLAIVTGEGSAVSRLFELTGVREHLCVASTEEEALAAIGAGDAGAGT